MKDLYPVKGHVNKLVKKRLKKLRITYLSITKKKNYESKKTNCNYTIDYRVYRVIYELYTLCLI